MPTSTYIQETEQTSEDGGIAETLNHTPLKPHTVPPVPISNERQSTSMEDVMDFEDFSASFTGEQGAFFQNSSGISKAKQKGVWDPDLATHNDEV